jgi:hypothetical protein
MALVSEWGEPGGGLHRGRASCTLFCLIDDIGPTQP